MNENSSDKFLKKAERFRNELKLSIRSLDNLLKEKKLNYKGLGDGVKKGTKTLTLDLAEGISSLYGLTYCEFISELQDVPKPKDLPEATRKIVEISYNKDPDKDPLYNNEAIIVLYGKKEGYKFTDSDITKHFPKDHDIHGSGRSVEWNKGKIRHFVEDTKTTRPPTVAQVKGEKIYRLIKEVSDDDLNKAKMIITEAKAKAEKDAEEKKK